MSLARMRAFWAQTAPQKISRKEKDMTEKKFKAVLIAARIEMLLEQAEIGNKDKEDFDAILEGLADDKRHQMEAYIDRMAEQEAARGEVLYWGGLRDGIRLMWKICQIGKGIQ